MAPRKTATKPMEIEKAQVSLPPPGMITKFALVGDKKSSLVSGSEISRREQLGLYYEMYRQHPVVHAAINRKAAVASSGGLAFKTPNTEDTENLPKTKVNKLRTFLRKSNIRKLLRLTYKDLDIYGESFWVIILDGNQQPMKAMRLNPRYMVAILTEGVITSWKYGTVGPDAIEYSDSLVLHFAREDPESDVIGMSPLHPLQRAVAQDIFAAEYNEAFFRNSAQTGIIFITKTSNAGEAERNRTWIEQNYVGAAAAHKPLLIEGDVDVKHSVANAAEMEFLQGRMFLREEISMALEVDLDQLGVHTSSNRSSGREAEMRFDADIIEPMQSIVEDEINDKLILGLLGFDDIVVTHIETDMRRSTEQVDIWDKHQSKGRMSVNDIRKEMGKPGVGTRGDVYAIQSPAGLVKLEDLEASTTIVEPMSGVGTDSQGGPNPPQQTVTSNPTAIQREDRAQQA